MYSAAATSKVSTLRFLRVIADPHRWRLMVELARSDRRVSELTRLVGDPQNLVSCHLRELRDAGWCRVGAVPSTGETATTGSTWLGAVSCCAGSALPCIRDCG
jgi:hypothetical protein